VVILAPSVGRSRQCSALEDRIVLIHKPYDHFHTVEGNKKYTMSVRTDKSQLNNIANQTVPGTNVPATPGAMDALATINAAQAADSPLGEANDFNTINPDHPLRRTVVATIRASLDDLCLRKAKSTWSPSPEALQQIFRQQKFVDLSGTSEQQGDLKVWI